MRKWGRCLWLSTVVLLAHWREFCSGLDVELADIWGTLSLQAGEGPVKVRCVAESILDDDNTTGEFLWMVGDEVLPAQDGGELEDMPEENRKRHSYFYYPIIDHDQKDLTCKYIVRDQQGSIAEEEEDSITLSITYNNFPVAPVEAGEYLVGQQVELAVDFSLYPEPGPQDVTWLIPVTEDQDRVVLRMGETINKYSASMLKPLGDHEYRATLVIGIADAGEDSRQHILVVKTPDETDNEKQIPVKFSLVDTYLELENEAGLDTQSTDASVRGEGEGLVEDVTDVPEGQQQQMGVGLIIIIVIIVLILLVCTGYCLYQKCCRTKEAKQIRSNSGKEYTPAATNDPNAV